MLWNQHNARTVARQGLIVDSGTDPVCGPRQLPLPRLPDLGAPKDREGGFSIEFAVKLQSTEGGQTLRDTRDANGYDLAVTTTCRGTVQLSLRGALGLLSTSSYHTDICDFG